MKRVYCDFCLKELTEQEKGFHICITKRTDYKERENGFICDECLNKLKGLLCLNTNPNISEVLR